MHLFGSHVSAAGGLDKAVGRATAVGCSCIQVFTKNNNQWNCKPLDAASIDSWKTSLRESPLSHPIAHASYLINLASPDEGLRQKSIDALVVELDRCVDLDIEGLVVHPGAFTTGSEAEGMQCVIDGVVETLSRMKPGASQLLLENTAGQGSCLGHSIEQLASMYSGIAAQVGKDTDRRLGFCIDTCHAFAAGYDITTKKGVTAFRKQLASELPIGTVRALHLNDSKKPLGSRVDRHEHIGRGCIGEEGFRAFLADPAFAKLPGYLETEKGTDEVSGEDWDVINLRVLRQLVGEAA